MVDVDKLSDAELRTKLLEFGFPVMPITGTTRKVMTKKLKLLLENKNKVGSADGRRSLGRYSSEEESDSDIRSSRKDKNRRVTMAAPVSSTSTRAVKKSSVEPEIEINNPRKREIRTTTTTTTTHSSRILKNAQDDFDTGSDSEPEIVASSNKYETSKYDDSFNDDVEFNKKNKPVLTSLSSSYSRYSPPKSEDISYSSTRNVSFGSAISPSRHTTVGDSTTLSGSLASDYAADKLNQIRSRLSLGNTGYDRSNTSVTTNKINLDEKDTPFLSNFTKRLSALNTSKKSEFDNKNDIVKEHDSNGSSPLYTRSYLSNFKNTRGREPTYDYKSREVSGKNNMVSFAVLAGAALFFIFLAVVYLGMRSDTSLITSGYISPLCTHNPQSKKGINCISEEDVQNAINLLNSIKPELNKRAIAHRCFDSTIKPQMSEAEIITFCQSNYGINDYNIIRNDLKNLEVMIFSNPEWGLSVTLTESNDGPVYEENMAKNMEQVVFNRGKKVTSLVMLSPDLPYKCTLYNTLSSALISVGTIGSIFIALYSVTLVFKAYRNYELRRKEEINYMVERIIEILQSAASEESEDNFVVINHVRDMILNVKERKAKQKSWEEAVKYINENESRVRTEVQTVQGEPFEVWRWIGSANLSMSMTSDSTDYKYRPGRRMVDVQYVINQAVQFPHRSFFFCQSKHVEIKNEVREGFFSVYVLRCKRCLIEYSICSEEPKNDLLDVNLACVAGIVSLGLDLYHLNELCSSIHIPTISGKNFQRYLDEIHEIYRESKSRSREGSFDEGKLLSSTPKKKDVVRNLNDDSGSKSSERLSEVLEDANNSLKILDFEEKKTTFLNELKKDINKIEALTVNQSNEELWFSERRKRLTASNFGRIYKLRDMTNRANIVKDLLYSTFKGNIYTEYGQRNESSAIEAFERKTGKKVCKSGLVVHKDYPFLAASPDGVIDEENALIEIKCPYKARDSTLSEAVQNMEVQFVSFVDGTMRLKREDKYYYQVQGQLHVTGKNFCYFVVWTPKDMGIELIRRDEQCWEKMLPKLERFYFDHLLPEILENI